MKRQRPTATPAILLPSETPDFILTSLLEENVWEVGYHLENPTDNLMWAMTCQWAMQHLLKLKCIVPPPALATWIITVYSTGNHKQIVWFERYLRYAAPKLQASDNVMIARWKGVFLRCMRDRSWWEFRPMEFLGGTDGFRGLQGYIRGCLFYWMIEQQPRVHGTALFEVLVYQYSFMAPWLREQFRFGAMWTLAMEFPRMHRIKSKEDYERRKIERERREQQTSNAIQL